MLLTTFFTLALMLSVHGADKCGDRCTSSQVCANNGTCIDESDLVKCGSWPVSYYCHKGHECCGYNGCMPEGDVCCGSLFYCPSGNTCCGLMYCCEAGTFCDGNGKCILDKYSTKKPLTTRPTTSRTTFYPTTSARTRYPTTESRTRYPTSKTTRWFNHYTKRSSYYSESTSTITFRWWYGVLAGAVVVTLVIAVAVVWKRRNINSNGPGQPGRGGVVISAPAQTYGKTPENYKAGTAPNTGVTIHTNGQYGKHNAAFVAT